MNSRPRVLGESHTWGEFDAFFILCVFWVIFWGGFGILGGVESPRR